MSVITDKLKSPLPIPYHLKLARALIICAFFVPQILYAQTGDTSGGVPVRISDPQGSHCIDASSEKVTLYVRRFFTEKEKNLIAQDGTAIATVTAVITGDTDINGNQVSQNLTFPSIGKQQINAYSIGRVSVPLEYEVASGLPLSSDKSHISGITLDVSLVKTKTKTTLSGVLSMASQALKQLPIPANPYSQIGSKILEFANQSVDTVIKQNGPYETGHLALAFAARQMNIGDCESAGKERTGAIVVLFKTGPALKDQNLLDVTNVDAQYCMSYSSEQTYEAIYAPRNPDKSCPKQGYKAVPNDYLMFLLSADPATVQSPKTVVQNNARVAAAVESELSTLKTPSVAGVTKGGPGGIPRAPNVSELRVVESLKTTYGQEAQVESIARCKEFKLPLSACGVREELEK